MITLTENEMILSSVIFALFCYVLYLLRKNSSLKDALRNKEALLFHQERLEERFRSISSEIFTRDYQNLLNIAKSELGKRENSFLNLIQPIQSTLKNFDDKISQIEKERVDSYSDLRRQVKDMMVYQQELHRETSALNKALSSPAITGHWGEMQLRRVVEISGMLPYCDFFEQQQGENSRLRPDMIIRLPGGKSIIVDAKTPINAYMQAVNTGNDEYLKAHAENIKKHVKILSQKAYWEQFSTTPEFVFMFLPGEAFFSTAIKTDPTLIEFGVQEKVIIATPITLITLLKTVSFAWRQEAITHNAKKIGEVGRSVYNNLEKLISLSKDYENKMQKNFKEYEKIGSFIEGKIIPDAEKLKNLGIEVIEEKRDSFPESNDESSINQEI